MKLSEQAWEESKDIYKELIDHKFNQELKEGTLPEEKFAYYMRTRCYILRELSTGICSDCSTI